VSRREIKHSAVGIEVKEVDIDTYVEALTYNRLIIITIISLSVYQVK